MIWLQRWSNVLFLHFVVPGQDLQWLLPDSLEVDTYEGKAWLSYVFFHLKLRPPLVPYLPGFSSLMELNIRTYVRHRGQQGIYFLRMFADNWLAIGAARLLTPLCYQTATMIDERRANGWRHIECRPADPTAGSLEITFRPTAPFAAVQSKSLDAWLLERYRLFVDTPRGDILMGEVEHPPWEAADIEAAAFSHCLDVTLPLSIAAAPDAMHYSPGVAARFRPFQRVTVSSESSAANHIRRAVQPAHVPADEDDAHAAALSHIDDLLLRSPP